MSGAVEIAAEALRAVNEGGDPCETCDQDAVTVLEAVHAAGWRIVRTEDVSHLVAITDEWLPAPAHPESPEGAQP